MTPPWLHPFYPIFDSADWLARMLPMGVRFTQLRIKTLPPEEIRAEIARARDLCRDHGARLVVNDYWELAIDLGCDFVHLGQEDLESADIKAIKKAGLKLGISTHDEAELERALTAEPDYVALGPIHETILKQMAFAPQGLERIGEWKKLIGDIPLVAIGGLKVEHARDVFEAGADAASVVTDVTLADNPEARVQAWLDAVRPYL